MLDRYILRKHDLEDDEHQRYSLLCAALSRQRVVCPQTSKPLNNNLESLSNNQIEFKALSW
jgi:hypothetical protein